MVPLKANMDKKGKRERLRELLKRAHKWKNVIIKQCTVEPCTLIEELDVIISGFVKYTNVAFEVSCSWRCPYSEVSL